MHVRGYGMSAAQDEKNVRDRVSDEEWQLRVDLAACYRAIAMHGWDDLIFTHISARAPGPDDHFLRHSYSCTHSKPLARCSLQP